MLKVIFLNSVIVKGLYRIFRAIIILRPYIQQSHI